jgi:hypothetical protein
MRFWTDVPRGRAACRERLERADLRDRHPSDRAERLPKPRGRTGGGAGPSLAGQPCDGYPYTIKAP